MTASNQSTSVDLPCGCGGKVRFSVSKTPGVSRFVRKCGACGGKWTFLVTLDRPDASTVLLSTHFAEGTRDAADTDWTNPGWIDAGDPRECSNYTQLWQWRIRAAQAHAGEAKKLGVNQLVCSKCGAVSDAYALGWLMPDVNTVLCPECA
jgi:hypothetical protein